MNGISADERAHLENLIRAAHDSGQLTDSEFDRRLGVVSLAQDRSELNDVFDRVIPRSNGLISMPYFAGLVLGPLLPAAIWWVSHPESALNRAAEQATRLQLWLLGGLVLVTLVVAFGWANFFWVFAWGPIALAVTVFSGISALAGRPWRIPGRSFRYRIR